MDKKLYAASSTLIKDGSHKMNIITDLRMIYATSREEAIGKYVVIVTREFNEHYIHVMPGVIEVNSIFKNEFENICTCPIHKISWNKNDYDKDCPLCENYYFIKHNPSTEWLKLNLAKGDNVKFVGLTDKENEEELSIHPKHVVNCYGKNKKVSDNLGYGFKIEGDAPFPGLTSGLIWDYDVIESVYRTEKEDNE